MKLQMFDIMMIYITMINISTFMAFGIDKSKARRGNFRISERMLLGMSAAGGSVGGIMGMQIFHHKTKHIHFNLGLPAMIVVQYIVVLLFLYSDTFFT